MYFEPPVLPERGTELLTMTDVNSFLPQLARLIEVGKETMIMHKLTETQLFKQLQKREKADGFEASEIASVVNKLITDSYPILQQVSRAFPLYTLHDPEHGFRVAENIFQLVPKKTLKHLNGIELSILLYSAYFHDIGMAASNEEFYNWLGTEDYKTFIGANDKWDNEIRRLEWRYENHGSVEEKQKSKRRKTSKKSGNADSIELRRMQDIVYTEFLRLNHAERAKEYVIRHFGQGGSSSFKIQIGQVNYAEHVALICKSHWDNTAVLKGDDFRRDLRIGQYPVNLQYCAVLLRLADLIDLDPDRTPKVLMDFIFSDLHKNEKTNEVVKKAEKLSAEEWAKHRSVLGYKITSDEIRVEAKCSHPAIQRGLIDWCNYIDYERRACRLLIQDNVKEVTENYHLDLINDIRTDFIKSDGSYIYTDFKFNLDYDRIVNLLMGTELWGDEMVVVRELLQNAIDACNHRAAISRKANIPYTPEITFSSTYDDNGQYVLTCSDNGTGMNQHIINNYLMCVGRSYYTSNEFKNKNLGLYPISQFGLGIMSCFMLTNKVNIETQYLDENFSKDKPLSVEIDSSGKYVVLRSLKHDLEGTKVSLIFDRFHEHECMKRIKGHFFDWDYSLHHYVAHVDIPIKIVHPHRQHDSLSSTIEKRAFFIPEIEWEEYPALEQYHREFIFEYDYENTNGLSGLFRFLFPIDSHGNLTFTAIVDSKFKACIDKDGDLNFTTANYDDKSFWADIKLENFDWDDDELRGVYRERYDRKPSSGYGGLLEAIKSNYLWSQDGLRIDLLDSHGQDDSDTDNKTNIFRFIPIPALNAAEFDLRGEWRTSLNVQRTDFVRNETFENFIDRYYNLAAEMLMYIVSSKDSFKDIEQKSKFIDTLVELADLKLQKHLKKAFKNIEKTEPDNQ